MDSDTVYEGCFHSMIKLHPQICMSFRQEGQGTSEELSRRDFRRELEDRERSNRDKRDRNRGITILCTLLVLGIG